MPDLEYNLSTGINQNTLLNVQLDTQERMRDLYEGFNSPSYQPPKAFIPKHFDADDILKGEASLPSLQEALYSKDPAIAKAALERARYLVSKDPTTRGLGMENKVKYQEGQDKFTTDHWYKEKQYTMYGFNPYKSVAENEDWLHHQTWDNYSLLGKTWRGVGTFAGRTLSKLVTGLVGTVGDLGSMTWNGLQEIGDLITNPSQKDRNNFWEDVSNNWLSRKMEEADQYVKQEILPTYKALDYDDKGAWSKLVDPYTWQNSFADGAGFLLQFAVPGAIFGKMAMAGKLSRSIGALTEAELATAEGMALVQKAAKAGMTLEKAKNVSGFTSLMGAEIPNTSKLANIAQTLTGSKNVGGISAHIFNTTMESVAETKSGFDETVKDLMSKGISRDEAVKIASENAPSQFWINMGILSMSNAFENKLLQKAIRNRELNVLNKLDDATLPKNLTPSTKVGKFFENNKWGNRIKFYGKLGAQASFWEGYWEENAQTAGQRWARGEYTRQGDDGGGQEKTEKGLSGFFKQLYNQTIDAAKGNDREAADSIMAGSVIGVLGGSAFSKISGERKEQFKDKANLVANYRNTRDAWMDLNTLSADLYDKEGKIIPEKAKAKAEEINEKLQKISSVFKRAVTAESLVDPQQREMLQHQIFADYVKAHIMSGTETALVNKLRNWGNKSADELSIYGVTEELSKDSSKWASLAETLVNKWNDIKDIKYSAPKNESVESYFAKTQAVKSLIYDYTALRDMSATLASQYADLKDGVNPFSQFPFQQAYNEKHAEILSLEATLKLTNIPLVKEQIQEKIDALKKEQTQRKKDLNSLGETKEDGTGFLFPKDTDLQKNPIDIKDVNDFLEYQYHQTDHENAVETHEKLIKDYSDPTTGIDKWNKTVDYWNKQAKDTEEAQKNEEDTQQFNETIEDLSQQRDELLENLNDAKTEEEREGIKQQIVDTTTKIDEVKDTLGKDDEDIIEDKSLEDINEALKLFTELQLAVNDSQASVLLAYETPFKTVNKETRNVKDEDDNLILWKENVLEHSYDHDLSEFVKEFSKEITDFPDKYETYIIKDTDELLRQRLSEKQYDEYVASRGQLGAIVVFRLKGEKEWLKFEKRKGTPIIAFSYNEKAFEDQKKARAEIKAKKNGISVEEALKQYEEQQKIADTIRTMVLVDGSLQVPVSASLGSLGLFPFTYEGNAFERFKGFHNGIITVVKDVNDFNDDVMLGDVVMEIPKEKTDSKLPFYIPVITGNLSTNTSVLGIRIQQAVQAINYAKFDTKEEAQLIVQNFLKNLYYVNDLQYFKIIKEGSKFKIAYFRKDEKGEEIQQKVFTPLKLKMLDSIYSGNKSFTIYEKDSKTNKFVPLELSNNEYKEFIHSTLSTKRKLLTVKRGKAEKVWTKKVNAYLNLQQIGKAEVDNNQAQQTTEQILNEVFSKPATSDLEEKKADIERIKQENNSLGESILQKLGYKNENRLANGNVRGGQSGWKIRLNIKNPKTGNSYFSNKRDKEYFDSSNEIIAFLMSYFGMNNKNSEISGGVPSEEDYQGHYIVLDKNGNKSYEPFKHLAGGEIGESDFTLYIGSADDVLKFISDVRTKHPEILKLLHPGNPSSDVQIDDLFKGRIEGKRLGFSGYGAPQNLDIITGKDNFTFIFNKNRVSINYGKSKSLSDITIVVEGSNKGYKVVGDQVLKKDFPELYKNIRNIVGFQLYGDYLQGSNSEFLKLTKVSKENAKYDAELKAVEQPNSELEAKKADIERRKQELGLQNVIQVYYPTQSEPRYQVTVRGEKQDFLAFFDKKMWNVLPKAKEEGRYVFDRNVTPEKAQEVVYKYLPKELIDLFEDTDNQNTIDKQREFDKGPIAEYVALYRKEYLQERIPAEEETLEYYRTRIPPNGKESNDRVIEMQIETLDKLKAELGALEATDEQKLNALEQIKEGVEEIKKGTEAIIGTLEDSIRRKKDAIEAAKTALEVATNKFGVTPQIKAILEKKGNETMSKLEKELEELEKLVPKDEEKPMSPLEELKAALILDQPIPNISSVTTIKVGKREYEINFDTNNMISASEISPTDVEKLTKFFENAHAYTLKNVNINGKNVYLVKYNKLGKFVIFDENYNNIPETKEMLANSEYQKFKDCE